MSTIHVRTRTLLVAALVGLSTVVVTSSPAAANSQHPTVKFVSPVCTNGEDVSVNGTINWKTGPVGTVDVNWAKERHLLWYEEEKQLGAAPSEAMRQPAE